MTQRLEQAAHAALLQRRAEEDRHDKVAAQSLRQVAVNLVFRRLYVLEQLLQKLVIEIGELLDEAGARHALLLEHVVGHLDQVGGVAGLVAIGALAHQVDIADRLALGIGQRYLAEHQGLLRHRLQRRHHFADARRRRVHLVDEDHVRDLVVVQKLEERAQGEDPLCFRLADQNRHIGGQ